MKGIFISYRRDDTAAISKRIYDRLAERFGAEHVFRDLDTIPAGADFEQTIRSTLQRCKIVLALIGPKWLDVRDSSGKRRIDDPTDFVRREIELALGATIPILPLLAEGATIPIPEQLPREISPLVRLQALSVNKGATFESDMTRILEAISRVPDISPPDTLKTMLERMDTALRDEIESSQRDNRAGRIATDGQLINETGGQYVYAFSLDEPWEPSDDTPITVQAHGSPPVRATVVTASGTTLTIATDVELPPESLSRITLVDDPTQLLERLRETLKSNVEGEALLGCKLFGLLPHANSRREKPDLGHVFDPRSSQNDAIQLALGSEVTYVIGPPGTGKTSTLAAMAYVLAREGRSVLVAAHTNIAVDNAIVKLAEMCQKASLPLLKSGRIIRYGAPQLQSVSQRDDIYPPKIIKRLGQDLEQQRTGLRNRRSDALERLRSLSAQQEQSASQWADQRKSLVEQRQTYPDELMPLQHQERQRVAAIDARLKGLEDVHSQAERRLRDAREDLARLVAKQTQLGAEHAQLIGLVDELMRRLADAQQMSSIVRLLKGVNRDRLARQLADVKQQAWEVEKALDSVAQEMEVCHQAISDLLREMHGIQARCDDLTAQRPTPQQTAARIRQLQDEIETCDRQIAKGDREIDQINVTAGSDRSELESRVEQCSQQIAAIDGQIRDIEKRLLDEAQVVATTLTKTYMDSRLRERRFDVIILDEASMAPLPAVYVAASRADNGVVAIGDPKQLAPIVQAKKSSIAKEWLGRDLFEVVNITLEGTARGDRRSALLREQSRMHPDIARIANTYIYHGLLKDIPQRDATDYADVMPYPDRRLLLCDTSDAGPVTTRPGERSRVNVYHALCSLAVARQALSSLPSRPSDLGNPYRVGIVTPYSKQAQLIQRMVKAEKLESQIRVGTVHRFQGLEFEIIVFDTVESRPITHRREFIGGGQNSNGERLINVAITRAKHKLIVVANHKHIATQFEEDDTLRLVVGEARKAGTFKSREILDTRVQKTGAHPRGTSPADGMQSVRDIEWLDETTFFDRFVQDIHLARQRIIIRSPFIRLNRTNHLIQDLQAARKRGVLITVVSSQVKYGDQPTDEAAVNLLREVGIDVQALLGMHEKLVLIDDDIVYFGSLNPLSHTGTSELMQRIVSREVAQTLSSFNANGHHPRASWGDDIVLKLTDLSNASCPKCGALMCPKFGRFGAFYGGVDRRVCDHTQNVTLEHLSKVAAITGITCPGCKKGYMRPNSWGKTLWLECGAATPCNHRRKIIIQQ